MKKLLRVILVVPALMLVCLSAAVFVPAAHSQTIHRHTTMPLTTCLAAPSDANCDNQWPDQSGDCWDFGNSYIVHESGWTHDITGQAMGIRLWRSRTCRTVWAYSFSVSGGAIAQAASVDVSGERSWNSSYLTQSYIWSPMGYAGSGECAVAWATGDNGAHWHGTPTFCF